jgi:hypothetical protein
MRNLTHQFGQDFKRDNGYNPTTEPQNHIDRFFTSLLSLLDESYNTGYEEGYNDGLKKAEDYEDLLKDWNKAYDKGFDDGFGAGLQFARNIYTCNKSDNDNVIKSDAMRGVV